MELSPYDFVGVELSSELRYKLLSSYQQGDFLVMPALLFHWLCEQRNEDEAWNRFYQGLDLGFTLATVGNLWCCEDGFTSRNDLYHRNVLGLHDSFRDK